MEMMTKHYELLGLNTNKRNGYHNSNTHLKIERLKLKRYNDWQKH